MKLEVSFINPFRIKIETVAPEALSAINLKLDVIHNRLLTMPTQDELNVELNAELNAELEQDLSAEIAEIAAQLEAAGGVPQETIDRVRALRTRVTGIVAVGTTPPTPEP